MKHLLTTLTLAAAALLSVSGISSCSDDDDGPIKNVDVKFEQALQQKYPEAPKNVEWDREAAWTVAEYHNLQGREVEVWFDSKARWVMTLTDLGRSLDQVTPEVATAFQNGAFSTWTIDDIDYCERPDQNFYAIDVEKQGYKDRTLIYAPGGSILVDAEESHMKIRPDTKI
ncbi:MAG: PepSY-like domain-containing protein [Clostridium sp.]|nr:PepSY-like domain-containing protein [Clostridium sp.]